ncbi:uncharacterized protein LOC124157406 [Ischnura elegans]|uniref:uncharacterized protein LOC124157406 n=1 Tax=Ischnura elegans TaxID=197161 RepID=UPI001ED89A41|nr:uncharacterized protein LOC124157406 [Ischnura elegans]
MSRRSIGRSYDSPPTTSDVRVKSVPRNAFSVSDNNLNTSKDSSDKEDNAFSKLWKMKFLHAPGRAQRLSDVRRSPYTKTPPHRERSRTDDRSLTDSRKSESKSVFRRLSLPGGSGIDSPVYADANAWVTDTIAEQSDTPKSERKWVSREKSSGPFIGSYQLLGDSLFVRFADQVLKSPAAIGEHGKFCNGFCVSGQTISDLDQRVSKDFRSTDVIVMIGTNDFLRRARVQNMTNDMRRLLDFLEYTAEKVVILTVPPIPRLENNPDFWHQWESYNKWLKNLDNGKTVKVIDVSHLFLLEPRKPDMRAFESHMGYGDKKRVDHIHLNRLGLLRLYREITLKLNIG